MYLKGYTVKKFRADGKRDVEASLSSSAVPAEFPKDGKGIEGLSEDDVLAPTSTVYIVNTGALYMMNEEMEFIEQ